MADKARSGFPISITFTEGELPTSTKLTSLAKQARRGLQLMEYAVGDIWNQGGDSILAKTSETADEPLMIANIGRALGSPRLVSPRIPSLSSITSYTHNFTNELGTHEARLPFPPAVGSTWGWTGTGCPVGAPQATKGVVDAANEWWVDTVTGHPGDMYFYDAIQADWELTYIPSVVGDIDSNATYNIIPDPDTGSSCGFQGLKLEYFNGVDGTQGYKIYLPPRQPLNLRRLDQSPQDDIHIPAIPHNQTTTPADAFLTFWQDDSAAGETGANASHYRYVLPKIITDNWSNSATIPAGLVYLWDPRGTGTIIEGVVFAAEAAATPKTWYLVATGSNLTAWLSTSYGLAAYSDANLKLSTHGAALYPATGLRLITVGTSVAQLASSTHQQFMDHDHGSQGSMTGKPVPHSKLSGLILEGTSPQLVPSKLTNDDHVMYLERHGYSDARDYFSNKILGDLVISSKDGADGYESLDDDSYGLYLGGRDVNYGLKMFWEYVSDKVILEVNKNGTLGGLDIRLDSNPSSCYIKLGIYDAGNCTLDTNGIFQIWTGADATRLTLSGSTVETNGIYTTLSKTHWITAPLVITAQISANGIQGPFAPADGEADGDYWRQNSTAGFFEYKGTWPAYLSGFISDWPDNMTLNTVQVFYGEAGSGLQVGIYKITLPVATSGYPVETCINSGGVVTTVNAGANRSQAITITGGTTFSRATDMLRIYFTSSVDPGSLIIRPIVRLNVTFNTVCPF
jgi:hypothetical protein